MNEGWELLPVAAFVLERSWAQQASTGAEADLAADWWIQAINPRAQTLLGSGRCSIGEPASRLVCCIASEARYTFAALWQHCLAQQTALTWDGPLDPTGSDQRWVRLELAPAHDADSQQRWHGVLIDLTAAKQRETALQSRVNAYQHLLDRLLDRLLERGPIAIANLNGDDPEITHVNAEFERTFGYSHQQVPRLSAWAERAYPDPIYRHQVCQQWERAVEQARRDQGAVTSLGVVVTTAWGQRLDVLISTQGLGNHLLVSLLDFSEQFQTERELRNAREQLALTALEVTEAIPVGTYAMVLRPGEAMASFSFMSERFLALTGLNREETLADPLNVLACVHPDDYDDWVQRHAEVFEQRRPFFGQTRIVVNGEVRWITAESVPRELVDGTMVWEGVLIDVTDRIEAQQRLERSQAHLERVLNNLPVAIAIQTLDPIDPKITFLNEHFTRSLGYTHTELQTVSDWARRAYPDPIYRKEVFRNWNAAMAKAVAEKGTVQQSEYRVTDASGRQLQMLISGVVLDDLMLIALIDLSTIREAEAKLRGSIEEKLRVSLSASAVAHEISQPLSSILLNSKLALEVLNAEPADAGALRSLLQPLASEAERVNQITERVSMLLRNVDTELVPLDLREVAHSALLQLEPRVLMAGLKLECLLPDHPCPLRGDAVQLQLAVINLLRNALDAIQDASPPSPRLQLRLQRQADWLELRVADNGKGFPEGFDPNLPLTTTKSRGTGIGLYVVRLTLDNHGGRLRLSRSAALGGAEVVMQLPLADQAGS